MCGGSMQTIIKIHPLLIFLPPLNQINLTRPAVRTLTAVWRHISEGGATGFDWQPCVAIVSTLSGYAVLHFLRARAAVTSTMSREQSQCSVFGCKSSFFPNIWAAEDAVGAALVRLVHTWCLVHWSTLMTGQHGASSITSRCFVPLSVHLTPICTAEHRFSRSQLCCFYQLFIAVDMQSREMCTRCPLQETGREHAAHLHTLQISSF